MNKERRKQLVLAARFIEIARGIIDETREAEEEAHDNMPESMQFNSERSDEMQDAMSKMEDALMDLENVDLEDLMEGDITTEQVIAATQSY